MGAKLRRTVVGGLVAVFLLAAAFGPRLLGRVSGVVVMLAAFAAGFAWLWLVVAPWAADRGRGPRR